MPTSTPIGAPLLQQIICYGKVDEWRNWKQLFLRVTYFEYIGGGISLLIFVTYMFTNLGPTKYPREKFMDPQNTHEKKFRTQENPREKFWTHEIPTRTNFGPTKYPREEI